MQSFSAKNRTPGLSERHLFRKRIHLYCSALLLLYIYNVSADSLQVPVQNSNTSDETVTYVVKDGDTFWDLAFEFTGDPFEWPFIWKDNPHIKNPHLIYPGDQLHISSASYKDSTTTVNDSDSGKYGQTTHAGTSSEPSLKEFSDGIKGKFLLSTRFFSSVPFLWTKRDSSGNMYPGNAVVEKPRGKGTYQLFDVIGIRPEKGATLVSGDTLDLFVSISFVRFRGSVANLVKKSGKAVVNKVEDRKISARLIEMSEVIKGGERAAKSESNALKGVYRFSQPESPVEAEVFTRVESTASPFLFQTLIIDKGENEGVRVGDVFAIFHKEKGKGSRYCMSGYAAHVNSISSSLVIVSISSNTVSSGDSAALIMRSTPEL